MVSKQLMGWWAFFDFGLLGFGAVAVAMSIIIQGSSDVFIKLSFAPAQLMSALILGVLLCITFVISIGAIVQPSNVVKPLMALNWVLLADSIVVVISGSLFWFVTLEEQNNFLARLQAASPETRIAVQDKLNCCGYFNTSHAVEFGGKVCVSAAAAVARNSTCVIPFTNVVDFSLNTSFNFIYGSMLAVLPLLVLTLCVIKKREEDERFKRIDAKRGGRGFV